MNRLFNDPNVNKEFSKKAFELRIIFITEKIVRETYNEI